MNWFVDFCTVLWILHLCLSGIDGFFNCNMTLVFIVPYKSQVYTDMHIVGPSIEIGLEKVLNTSLSRCDVQVIMPKDESWQSSCDGIETNIAAVASKMYYSHVDSSHPIAAFFGLTCTFANVQLLSLLNEWNLFLIEGSSIAFLLADRVKYPTVLGFSYTQTRAGKFFYEIVHLFGWSDVSVMYNAEDSVWRAMITAMDYFKTQPSTHVTLMPFFLKSRGTVDIDRVVQEAHKSSRINIVMGDPGTIRNVMLAASRFRLTQGDHIYIAGAYFKTKNYFGMPQWNVSVNGTSDPVENEVVRQAFRSLFLVKQQIPSSADFHIFDKEVQRRAIAEYNHSIVPDNEVNVHAMGFHDAILTYAKVIREVAEDDENVFDARTIARRFSNRKFKGVRGDLTPDKYNNLNGNFELWNFHFESGVFVKVVDFEETADLPALTENIVWPSPDGKPPNTPLCGFAGDNPICRLKDTTSTVVIAVCVAVVGVTLVVTLAICWRIYRKSAELAASWWQIVQDEVTLTEKTTGALGIYRHQSVRLRPALRSVSDKPILEELKKLRTTRCPKLVQIVGITTDNFLVEEHCSRGSIFDLVQNEDRFLQDSVIKFSAISDLAEGLAFIHHSWIRCHGQLHSKICLVNSQFTVKISDYALQSLFAAKCTIADKFWTAPEILRCTDETSTDVMTAHMGDIYSLGVVYGEIMTMEHPYSEYQKTPEEILSLLVTKQYPPVRPQLRGLKMETPYTSLQTLVQKCWSEEPSERPDAAEIVHYLRLTVGRKQKSLAEEIMAKLENYTGDLEALITMRTHELVEEKRKIQTILFEILPRSVALDLMAGIRTLPEMFESATVLFSAIEGFADIVSRTAPIDVLSMLQTMCTVIDSGIGTFDVYKIETITDTYVIASGLPTRNGSRHASEVARCALYLRNVSSSLRIEHKFRTVHPLFAIGFHTGQVMTGVIGRRMPRYCVFGDTINTASRMESTSVGGKIQVSEDAMKLLVQTSNLTLEPRGEIFVKGKGNMKTFWLMDRTRRESDDLDLESRASKQNLAVMLDLL